MHNFFPQYSRYIIMLMLVTTGYQFLRSESDSSFPIFDNTTQPQSEPEQKLEPELEAEFERRVTTSQEEARSQAERRAKDHEKTQDEVKEAGRLAAQEAARRVRKDVERERAAIVRERAALARDQSSALNSSGKQADMLVNSAILEPKPEPENLPSHESVYKTEEVTDEAEYVDVLQKKYADQREQKISTVVVKFPNKLDVGRLPSRSKEVDGNYARIRIGAYDFAFKMIDDTWTIEFFDAVYRYDKRGVIKRG